MTTKCMVCGRPCRRTDSLCARLDCVAERKAVAEYKLGGMSYVGYRYAILRCPYCPRGSQVSLPIKEPYSAKKAQEVLWRHIESHPERYT